MKVKCCVCGKEDDSPMNFGWVKNPGKGYSLCPDCLYDRMQRERRKPLNLLKELIGIAKKKKEGGGPPVHCLICDKKGEYLEGGGWLKHNEYNVFLCPDCIARMIQRARVKRPALLEEFMGLTNKGEK